MDKKVNDWIGIIKRIMFCAIAGELEQAEAAAAAAAGIPMEVDGETNAKAKGKCIETHSFDISTWSGEIG